MRQILRAISISCLIITLISCGYNEKLNVRYPDVTSSENPVTEMISENISTESTSSEPALSSSIHSSSLVSVPEPPLLETDESNNSLTCQPLVLVKRNPNGGDYKALQAYAELLKNEWSSTDPSVADAIYESLNANKIPIEGYIDIKPYGFEVVFPFKEQPGPYQLWLNFEKEGYQAILGCSEREIPMWRVNDFQTQALRELLQEFKVSQQTVAELYLSNGKKVGNGSAFELPERLDYCFSHMQLYNGELDNTFDYKIIYTSTGKKNEYMLWLTSTDEVFVQDTSGQSYQLDKDVVGILTKWALPLLENYNDLD